MKRMYVIGVFFIFISCTKFLLGEKKLTYDMSTPYIKTYVSSNYKNTKFYIIPIENVKECRKYPYICYLGSENEYSFFGLVTKLSYKDEIVLFALPDSICVNKYPNTLDTEFNKTKKYHTWRDATIVDNKMIVGDDKGFNDIVPN